jgi:hypothetical protein
MNPACGNAEKIVEYPLKKPLRCCVLLSLGVLVAAPAHAQLNGENLLGDNGVKSGSQPAPGFYMSALYYLYNTDTIKDRDGNRVTPDPTQAGSQTIQVVTPVFTYVSRAKLLGAHYGMMAVVPMASGSLEAPGFGFGEDVSVGAADIYLVPFQLGWHTPRADVITAFALFAPTGRYTQGASDNLGKNMWSYELSAGTTLYFDEKKTLSVAAAGYWETHTRKKGTGNLSVGNLTLTGVKVGQLMTLEGGLAKSFLGDAAHVGLAYYGQWKVTKDEFGFPATLPGLPGIGKHRVWGLGPDVTLPIAAKSKLISLVNVRYLWETGAQLKTQGDSLVVTATFPIPSIKIPPTK